MFSGIVLLQTEAVMFHCFCLFVYNFGMPSTLNEEKYNDWVSYEGGLVSDVEKLQKIIFLAFPPYGWVRHLIYYNIVHLNGQNDLGNDIPALLLNKSVLFIANSKLFWVFHLSVDQSELK